MGDVYRTMAKRFEPVCDHCLTALWMAYDVMWDHFICRVCDTWVEPYWRLPSPSESETT